MPKQGKQHQIGFDLKCASLSGALPVGSHIWEDASFPEIVSDYDSENSESEDSEEESADEQAAPRSGRACVVMPRGLDADSDVVLVYKAHRRLHMFDGEGLD